MADVNEQVDNPVNGNAADNVNVVIKEEKEKESPPNKEEQDDISENRITAVAEKVSSDKGDDAGDETASSSAKMTPKTTMKNMKMMQNKSQAEKLSRDEALTLAAVAAAAEASHSSPAAAAEAARALAQRITAPSTELLSNQYQSKKIQEIDSSMVKRTLLETVNSDSNNEEEPNVENNNSVSPGLRTTLSTGNNDYFLLYLLALSWFRAKHSDDIVKPTPDSSTPIDLDEEYEIEEAPTEDSEKDRQTAQHASNLVLSLSLLMEEEYNGLEPYPALVHYGAKKNEANTPSEPVDDPDNGKDETTSIDRPSAVSRTDALQHDATVGFFLACQGDQALGESSESRDDLLGIQTQQETNVVKHEVSTVQETTTTTSVLSSVFQSVKRGSIQKGGSPRHGSIAGVFRKRSLRRPQHTSTGRLGKSLPMQQTSLLDPPILGNGTYVVEIEREMLGLTVENVLERTVVRTVIPGGAARRAGAKVGSLIVKVGNTSTQNLTHFETVNELTQSQRPLKLMLRQIGADALKDAREEMGRLIRGGGFECHRHDFDNVEQQLSTGGGAFTEVLNSRWQSQNNSSTSNSKDAALASAGERLVWILTMIVVGLEKESIDLDNDKEGDVEATLYPSHHSAASYGDASKSVSKVLYDYVSEHLNLNEEKRTIDTSALPHDSNDKNISVPPVPRGPKQGAKTTGRPNNATNRQGMNRNVNVPVAPVVTESRTKNLPLLRIGDVLHRTRTFLADPTSRPAELLRGELIAFLCDVLDIDTEMELSEEEAASSVAGGGGDGPINDLGSAGSLLKLIVVNFSSQDGSMPFVDEEPISPTRQLEEVNADSGLSFSPTLPDRQRNDFVQGMLLKPRQLQGCNCFMAVVHRLAASRSTSARITSCSLGPVLWGHLDFPYQLQLRGVLTRALYDAEIIVRKSTATVLHEIAELVFDPRSVPWLVLMCERLMTDPEPQLRAAAMTLTWHLAEHLPNAFLGDASKGSRSLRRLPPRSDPTFAEVYLLQCKLLPVATRLADDRSPSVRLAVAAQCDRLCDALGDHWSSVVIDLLQALLSDSDERVRSEAVLCVPRLVEIVLLSTQPNSTPRGGVGVLEALLPLSMKLAVDPSTAVRVSLATSAGELLTLLVGLESLEELSRPLVADTSAVDADSRYNRHKKHVDETLIPLVQKLLHDGDPEVTSSALRAVTNASRGNVREIRSRRNSTASEDDTLSLSSYHSHASTEKKEPVFIPVLSETQVLRLLPTLSDLANSRQWRVRQSAVEIVPALLACTHKLETRSEIAQLCVRLMEDAVDAVRTTAAVCLCLGGGVIGGLSEESSGEWLTAVVLPQLRRYSQSDNSRHRILSLKMIEVVFLHGVHPFGIPSSVERTDNSNSQISASPSSDLVQIATSLSNDCTVNVRLNVGRTLANIAAVIGEKDLEVLGSALVAQIKVEKSREGGGDRDVLYFAQRAIARVQQRMEEIALNARDDTS